MKRFQFQQEALLRLKRQLRRQAEIKLWQAQHKVNQVKARLSSLSNELDRLSTIQLAHQSERATWSWCLGARALQMDIAQTQQELMECNQSCESVRADFQKIDVEYEALNSLRINKWKEYRSDIAAERQMNLDESAMRKWLTGSNDHEETELDD